MQWPSEYRVTNRFQSNFLGRTGKHFLIDYVGRLVTEKEELRMTQKFYLSDWGNDHALDSRV